MLRDEDIQYCEWGYELDWTCIEVEVDLFLTINRLECDSDEHAGLSLLGARRSLLSPLSPPPPPPPYVNVAGYRGPGGDICGHAVVGDTHILISTTGYGTYSFDTATSAWTKSADWRLPFRGRAEHVPEHGLWFGISNMDNTILGAWNLSSPTPFQQPMASLQLKGFSVESHSGWKDLAVYASQVVHLGAGKLCIAKLFSVDCKERDEINFAMLTGVEVVRGRGGKLRIVKHKSCRYNFGTDYTPGYLL
uniref:Uncharacterized protein n=1 Tax=Oryza punctata TaxID=4537 RepID=A0A0E0JVH3_ORYPU